MSKRTKIVLASCLLVIALCIGLFFYLRKRSKEDTGDGTTALPNEAAPNSDNLNEADPVLRRGSRGEEVKTLQRFLHERLVLAPIYDRESCIYSGQPLESLAIDGIFGPKTECACVWWFGKSSVKLSEVLA